MGGEAEVIGPSDIVKSAPCREGFRLGWKSLVLDEEPDLFSAQYSSQGTGRIASQIFRRTDPRPSIRDSADDR